MNRLQLNHLQSLHLLTCVALSGSVFGGCDMDPVTYETPPVSGTATVAGAQAGVSSSPPVRDMTMPPQDMTPPVGGDAPITTCADEPNMEILATKVGPSFAASCGGSGCHASNSAFNFKMPNGVTAATNPFSAEQAAAFLEIIRGTVSFGDPMRSFLFTKATDTHAPTTYRIGSNNYEDLSDWIKDGRVCTTVTPTPDPPEGGEAAGVMGGQMMSSSSSSTASFCDALPLGDPLRRPNYYEVFRDEVNPILTNSCAQGGCHAEPSAEYGFWIVDEDDPCSVQANFITSQLYINFLNQLASPILTAPIDPNHGGYMIFNRGSSSPEYVTIKNWITLGAVR